MLITNFLIKHCARRELMNLQRSTRLASPTPSRCCGRLSVLLHYLRFYSSIQKCPWGNEAAAPHITDQSHTCAIPGWNRPGDAC